MRFSIVDGSVVPHQSFVATTAADPAGSVFRITYGPFCPTGAVWMRFDCWMFTFPLLNAAKPMPSLTLFTIVVWRTVLTVEIRLRPGPSFELMQLPMIDEPYASIPSPPLPKTSASRTVVLEVLSPVPALPVIDGRCRSTEFIVAPAPPFPDTRISDTVAVELLEIEMPVPGPLLLVTATWLTVEALLLE
ncbi:MAG TPA: hypothetical protein VKU61_07535 [Candidatus Binatia bacterium]|nr:hypothetical protein [Candidatus Binatia bacterium]